MWIAVIIASHHLFTFVSVFIDKVNSIEIGVQITFTSFLTKNGCTESGPGDLFSFSFNIFSFTACGEKSTMVNGIPSN